jgi:glycosyltransferase involved in cell wall biosynthesis
MKKIVFVYRYKYKDYPIIVEYCSFLERTGYQVFYIGLTSIDEVFYSGQTQVQHINAGRFRNPVQEASFVLNLINAINPDLVHVFQYRGCAFLPLLSKFQYPFLLDVRTVNVGNRKGKYSKLTFLKNRLTWLESLFYKDKIALTGEIKKILLPNWRPIPIIPLGANKRALNPVDKKEIRRAIRAQYGIRPQDKVLLYCGTLNPGRRVGTILQAVQKVFSRMPGVYLFIIGNDVNPESLLGLQQLAQELEIADRVFFTGQIAYEQVVTYYCAADIGLCFIPQTSFFDQQPPTKLFEYMMAGLLVVGTKTRAQTQIIQHGVNGFLCEDSVDSLSEAIQMVLCQQEDVLEDISRNGFVSVDNYNWEQILGTQLLPIYKQLSV